MHVTIEFLSIVMGVVLASVLIGVLLRCMKKRNNLALQNDEVLQLTTSLQKQLHEQAMQIQALEIQHAHEQERAQNFEEQHRALEGRYNAVEHKAASLEHELQKQQALHEQEQAHHNAQLRLLEEAKERLSEQFEALSTAIYEKRLQSFERQSKEKLELLLKPFKEQVQSFSKRQESLFEQNSKGQNMLQFELKRLQESSVQLSEDANNLAKALKGESKRQGDWGELVLQRLLDDSGLHEGREYYIQKTLKSEEGATFRPDVVLALPQERAIIIDSKVSLRDYERYINAPSEEEATTHLNNHIKAIQNHINSLSAKAYENLVGVNSLDFVLMFLPIEGAFITALQHDHEFLTAAIKKNIMIVSPSTLMVTLRTIEYIWRSEQQSKNAQEIAKEAANMYDKFVLFIDALQKVGTQIDKAQESYGDALNRLSSGKGNLIRRAQRMKELGAQPKKEIDEQLINSALSLTDQNGM